MQQNIIIIKTTDSKLVKQVFKGTWVIDQDAVKDLEEEGERELVQVVDLKSKQTYSNTVGIWLSALQLPETSSYQTFCPVTEWWPE